MVELASEDERFMATVYAMNTLLIHKGIYTRDEFETLFAEWMRKHGSGSRSGFGGGISFGGSAGLQAREKAPR